MTKVMRYENGKAIAGQVDAPFKVDWSDWINMTDAQKKGKKWLIENVPGAEGEIDAELFTPLWTNPNPTASSFAAQNITLASSDYDFLLWNYNVAIPGGYMLSEICRKGDDVWLSSASTSSSGAVAARRHAVRVNDTVYTVNDSYTAIGNNSGAVNNSYSIPIAVYGFKSTVKIKFDALAKDVSTLASKCMLEDGETSVEDKITALDSRTKVYHKVFSGRTDPSGNLSVHVFAQDYIPIFANSLTTNYMCYVFYWPVNHTFYCHFMTANGTTAPNVDVSGDVYFIPFTDNPFPS